MCGVVGYIGSRSAYNLILTGLKRLEYRGYDSAGIAIHQDGDVIVKKEKGKIAELEKLVNGQKFEGTCGIGHTRWATHGEPNRVNAHPHSSSNKKVTLVHNGIIENYSEIKELLESKGYVFSSETDTEVLTNLIDYFYDDETALEQAVRQALSQVVGAYGVAVMARDNPDVLVAARKGSPLLIGVGTDEYFIASDVAAIIDSTRQVIYLAENEMAILTREGYSVKTITNVKVTPKVQKVTFDIEAIEKSGFDHFMLKEIFEQPKTIAESMRGRLIEDQGQAVLGGLQHVVEDLRNANRIVISACGTSWHAALIGEYLIEEFCRIPVEVEYASEFRYRDPIIQKGDILIGQADKGYLVVSLANIKQPDLSAVAEEIESTKDSVENSYKNDIYTQYISALEKDFVVEINQNSINQVINPYSN